MSAVYLHHILIHFPIGLFVTAGLIALVNLWKKSSTLDWMVTIVLTTGLVIGIFAAIMGMLSAEHLIEEGHATINQVAGHRNTAILSLVFALLGIVSFILYNRDSKRSWLRTASLIFAIIAGIAVTFAGDRGGKMIHPSLGLFATEHTHEQLAPHLDSDEHHHDSAESLDHDSSETGHGHDELMPDNDTHNDEDAHHHESSTPEDHSQHTH